ncbi:class I SAM-dependent methyltransferase [Stetteria hydrogenophila]
MPESPCASVDPRDAERARRILAARGLLARGLKPGRAGGRILFPVTSLGEALEALREAGIPAEPCTASFQEARRGPPSPREQGLPGYWLVGDILVFNPREGVSLDRLRAYAGELVARGVAGAAWLKVGTHGPYRLPRLVHLAGEERTETTAREYGLRFRVDVARAYYNPRLSFEHRRVAEQARDGERVLDMFTGVGGFAVHIAHLRAARVLAVDINPHAVRLAAWNVCANKLRGTVALARADARLLPSVLEPVFDRVVMNHPTGSLGFIREACSLATPRGAAVLHVYTLASEPSQAASAVAERLEGAGCRAIGEPKAREVLEYSPRQSIYAVDVEVERRDGDG